MKQYKLNIDKEYIFDIYWDRYDVITEKPTIVIYLKETEISGIYKMSLCEFSKNPKNDLHNNPPVIEALNNNAFLLLQRDDKAINDALIIYFRATVDRFIQYLKYNQLQL